MGRSCCTTASSGFSATRPPRLSLHTVTRTLAHWPTHAVSQTRGQEQGWVGGRSMLPSHLWGSGRLRPVNGPRLLENTVITENQKTFSFISGAKGGRTFW